VASGQAAETLALLNLCDGPGHIVSSASLYGGTYNLLHYTLPKFGVEVTFIDDADDIGAWEAAVRPDTKAFYGESMGNPKSDVFPYEEVSGIAHAHGIPLVIDNTVTTPYLVRPFDHGADIVVHSATKFIGGHGTSIGGVIVDSGKFDYVASGRFPNFTEPDPSYHGLVYSELPEPLRPAQYILKVRLQYQRDLGPASAPFNNFLFLQGLETLSLRMERHCQNAQAVAEWLEARDEVQSVAYAGLPSSKWYDRQQRYQPRGAGAIMAFEIEGGVDVSSKGSSCSRTWPTSATSDRSPSTRPRPRTRSSRPRSRRRPGSRRGWCASASASRRSTTSSPTSRRASAPRRAEGPWSRPRRSRQPARGGRATRRATGASSPSPASTRSSSSWAGRCAR
jgi:O-acetylhomoserine (thiol)-lyase